MFSSNTSQVASSAANYIEDVFSTYLYTGTGTSQTITNGIDLSTKGGMVWIKQRNQGNNHRLFDTNRGIGNSLVSNSTAANAYFAGYLNAFNVDGFGVGTANDVNESGFPLASWTFRKQEKFFDVVTYTGNGGSNRAISHSLGSVPGCYIIKATSTTSNWYVYHRGADGASGGYINQSGILNSTAAFAGSASDGQLPSSTAIYVVDSGSTTTSTNSNGVTYVAYIFAHNAGGFGLTGADNVISCGSVSVASGTSNAVVNLGYEPQWVLWRNADVTDNWYVFDNMRGIGAFNTAQQLNPNLSDAESAIGSATYPINITSTGFSFNAGNFGWGASSNKFIYIAIRRGPMKTPTSGTSVFAPVTATASNNLSVTAGFPPDLAFVEARVDGVTRNVIDRLRGGTTTSIISLESASTGAEQTYSGNGISFNSNSTGIIDNFTNFNQGAISMVYWMFRRAPSFMDVVCYTGTGSATTFSHNLGVVPELMIVKRRGTSNAWAVYANNDNTDYLVLNTSAATVDDNTYWNDTSPTNTVFSVGTNNAVNASGSTYVAYLFATCAGVSKVGSYTGSGTTKQIDCGFTGGARFVLIKRTDSTGDWYVWDSARGIVSGNDPYLLLNSTAAEVTNTDYVDTYSAGFEISSTAPAAINANGGSFIFLAIA